VCPAIGATCWRLWTRPCKGRSPCARSGCGGFESGGVSRLRGHKARRAAPSGPRVASSRESLTTLSPPHAGFDLDDLHVGAQRGRTAVARDLVVRVGTEAVGGHGSGGRLHAEGAGREIRRVQSGVVAPRAERVVRGARDVAVRVEALTLGVEVAGV